MNKIDKEKVEYPEVLDLVEASNLLKLPASTIRALVKQGKLPGRMLGRKTYRFSRDALLRWLAAPAKVEKKRSPTVYVNKEYVDAMLRPSALEADVFRALRQRNKKGNE